MTLLLGEVIRFVAGATLWILALLLVTGIVAAGALFVAERHVDPRSLGVAAVAGGLVAALAHRIGTGIVWAPRIGDRPLPIVWAAAGAAAASAFIVVRRRRATD
jgi:hypothetical protein